MKKLLIIALLLFSSSYSLAMEKHEEVDLHLASLIFAKSEIENITEKSTSDGIYYGLVLKNGTVVVAALLGAGSYFCMSKFFDKTNSSCYLEAFKGKESFNNLRELYKSYAKNK